MRRDKIIQNKMSLLSEKKIPAEIKVIYIEFIETWKRK